MAPTMISTPTASSAGKELGGYPCLELTAAGFDWLEGRFASRQPDWKAFARELYAFCPDVVTQGTENR